jgi:hypothetical protein
MERCPVCNARFKDELICYRCGTDLSILVNLESQATALERRAVTLCSAGKLIEARRAAARALELQRGPLARVLLEFLTREIVAAESTRLLSLLSDRLSTSSRQ